MAAILVVDRDEQDAAVCHAEEQSGGRRYAEFRRRERHCRPRLRWPATVPVTPLPGIARTLVASCKRKPGFGRAFEHRFAPGDAPNVAPAKPPSAIVLSSVVPCRRDDMLAMRGLPSVSVPVLSRTTVSIWASRSRASPLLKRMPSCAPRPIATVSAAGTASPIAQGQAMTSTVTAAAKAKLKLP